MGARTRLLACGWVVAAAGGCLGPDRAGVTSRSVFPDRHWLTSSGKSAATPTDHPAKPDAPAATPPDGSVAPASAQTPAQTPPAQPLPGTPAVPPPGAPAGPPPVLPPPAAPPGLAPPGPVPGVVADPLGPNVRTTPTVGGARLDLGPGEFPIDRAVELSRRIDAVAAQNLNLQARIAELEGLGRTREQAVNEAVRDAEAAAAEAAKARADLITARADAANARTRLEQVEREDVETLRAVVLSLERLLTPPAATPPLTPRREP